MFLLLGYILKDSHSPAYNGRRVSCRFCGRFFSRTLSVTGRNKKRKYSDSCDETPSAFDETLSLSSTDQQSGRVESEIVTSEKKETLGCP